MIKRRKLFKQARQISMTFESKMPGQDRHWNHRQNGHQVSFQDHYMNTTRRQVPWLESDVEELNRLLKRLKSSSLIEIELTSFLSNIEPEYDLRPVTWLTVCNFNLQEPSFQQTLALFGTEMNLTKFCSKFNLINQHFISLISIKKQKADIVKHQ